MKHTLIVYPSWEERSALGVLIDLQRYSVDEIILILNKSEKYESAVNCQLIKIQTYCEQEKVAVQRMELLGDSMEKWQIICSLIQRLDSQKPILLDITTMSRNLLWSILHFLDDTPNPIDIIYHQPSNYAKDWVSREPEQPRLLFKHSGIMDIGRPTCLIIMTGFDVERTRQIVARYEPRKVILMLQSGTQFDNDSRNVAEEHIKSCVHMGVSEQNIEIVYINSYEDDWGYSILNLSYEKVSVDYNVIVASFGPKLGAVTCYQLNRFNPKVGLCYLPSKEYNIEYCNGINDTYVMHYRSCANE